MIQIDRTSRILFAVAPVDFRKSFDGLCGIVRNDLRRNPTDGTIYVFYNKRRDRVKLLIWDGDGFWLHFKLLEQGTFELPALREGQCSIELTRQDVALLLNGIELSSVRLRKRYDAAQKNCTDTGSM